MGAGLQGWNGNLSGYLLCTSNYIALFDNYSGQVKLLDSSHNEIVLEKPTWQVYSSTVASWSSFGAPVTDFSESLVAMGMPQGSLYKYCVGLPVQSVLTELQVSERVNKVFMLGSSYMLIDLLDRYSSILLEVETMSQVHSLAFLNPSENVD